MNSGLAHRYLMQSLAMKRKNLRKIREKFATGKCILDGCDRPHSSRGLCDSHRQLFYQALRAQGDEAAKIEFEQEQIRQGHILASGEQMAWTSTNPFLQSKAAS